MKKLMMFLMAMCLMLSMSASAKDDKKDAKKDMGKEVSVSGIVTDSMCAKMGDKAKMKDAACVKKCADSGMALVNDADGKVWTIENADAVKGHEGHHVKVSGHPNAEKGSIHIMTVAMLTDKDDMGKHKGEMKHDEMKK